jgi:tRNA(fMet)-specific endonuclease VapC
MASLAVGADRKTPSACACFSRGDIAIVPFEEKDAVIAGDLRATLEMGGTSIGPYDVLLAAQALRAGATFVTANVSEFTRVAGLTWEDWTVET